MKKLITFAVLFAGLVVHADLVFFWALDAESTSNIDYEKAWIKSTLDGTTSYLQATDNSGNSTYYAEYADAGLAALANITGLTSASFVIELFSKSGDLAASSGSLSYQDIAAGTAYDTSSISTPTGKEGQISTIATTFTAVPEPTSGLLLLIGGMLLAIRRRRRVLSLCAVLMVGGAFAATKDLYVGKGYTVDSTHFATVQAAINAVTDSATTPHVIHVAPGTYVEKVEITSRPNVTITADDPTPNATVISYNAASSTINPKTGEGYGTDGSATFTVGSYNGNFEMDGITVANTAGIDAGQALALIVYGYGKSATFRKCRFLGYQDTLETKNGAAYFEDCYIEGTVDFVFGGTPTLFNRCELHVINGGTKITACAHDASNKVGYLFYKCRVTKDQEAGVLGRAWYAGAKVWWVACDFGSAIQEKEWEEWNEAQGKTDYRVYGCYSDATFSPSDKIKAVLTTGTIDDFWTAMNGFGYTSILDIYKDHENETGRSFRPTITPATQAR